MATPPHLTETAAFGRKSGQTTAASSPNLPIAKGQGATGKLLTPSDIAKRLQVTERTVTIWLRKSYLRGYKIGKEWRISAMDLEAFLQAGANKVPIDRS